MENLGWGLQISALGMGLVFALLALLWGLLVLVLRFDRVPVVAAQDAITGDPAASDERVNDAADTDTVDPDLLAAIVVATLTHRAIRRREAAPVMRIYRPGSQLFASRWVAVGRSRQNQNWQRKGK